LQQVQHRSNQKANKNKLKIKNIINLQSEVAGMAAKVAKTGKEASEEKYF